MDRRQRTATLSFLTWLAVLLAAPTAIAQGAGPRSAILGPAAGLLMAASHMDVLQKSECRSAARVPVNLADVVRQVFSHLPPATGDVLEARFTSAEFQMEATLEPERTIPKMAAAFMAAGDDRATACARVARLYETSYRDARENWDQAIGVNR